jgi:transposase-like protein
MKTQQDPKTLVEAINYFSNPDRALAFMTAIRWPDGTVTCPRCGSKEVTFLANAKVWKCRGKHTQQKFSIKVGTVMEDSPISLTKWLPAIWMMVNCKNGISSYELGRALGVTQKTAWFMLHRIRLATQTGTFEKLGGEVEADETFIGGLARNMHRDKRGKRIKGTGGSGKAIVMGMLERSTRDKASTIRAKVMPDTRRVSLHGEIKQHVEPGSHLFTDAHTSYRGLHSDYAHQVIDHAVAYVKGNVHTNGIENFWSLLKRGLKGTYVSVEPFHLFRYLDEQSFRFNTRKENDAERFASALASVAGRRLTYRQLIGQTTTSATT